MIALKVTINDSPPVVAGIQDQGVVSAIVTLKTEHGSKETETNLNLSGLNSSQGQEFLTWVKSQLQPGDTIKIEVIETAKIDGPTERRREENDYALKAEREYYEEMKKKFGD